MGEEKEEGAGNGEGDDNATLAMSSSMSSKSILNQSCFFTVLFTLLPCFSGKPQALRINNNFSRFQLSSPN